MRYKLTLSDFLQGFLTLLRGLDSGESIRAWILPADRFASPRIPPP